MSKHVPKKAVRKIAAKAAAAFTIVELVVVIGIFGLIMGVALSNQQALNSTLLISNLAYEIGLITRETQAYGIGVRSQPNVTDAKNFQGAFGMYLKLDQTTHTTDMIYVFKDKNNNGKYDSNPDPLLDEIFSINQFQNQRGNKVVGICVAENTYYCQWGTGGSVDALTVIFKRPNPEASFYVSTDNGTSFDPRGGTAMIVVNTPAGKNCRAVIIEPTGQVRIESAQSSVAACANS